MSAAATEYEEGVLAVTRTFPARPHPWLILAVVVWGIMTLAVCVRCVLQPTRQSVYPVWKLAGHDWRTGHDLYEEGAGGHPTRFGYRYAPLMAAVFTVCDLVPQRLGNVVFRLLNGGVFLAAVGWWLRSGVPLSTPPAQRGLIFFLLAPLALGSLNNAQVNLLLIALMLCCLTAVTQERWNLAAFCLALAFWLKLYPVALALLLGMLYPRRFLPRFLAAVALLGAVPFLLQSPEYVVRQYGLWWGRISHNDAYRRFWPLAATYRDVYLLFRAWKLPVSLGAYTALQLAGAAGCAVLAGLARWRLGTGKLVLFALLTLSTAWMLVLGPAPESCTYILIGPSLAWWLVQSFEERRRLSHYAAVNAYGLLLLCVATGTSHQGIQLYHVAGLQPLAVLLFAAGFSLTLVGWLWQAGRTSPGSAVLKGDVASLHFSRGRISPGKKREVGFHDLPVLRA